MSTPSVPVTKPTKAVFAAVWNTMAAVQIFLGVVAVATEDGALDLMDIAPIVTGFLTLGATVAVVWRTRNDPKTVAR